VLHGEWVTDPESQPLDFTGWDQPISPATLQLFSMDLVICQPHPALLYVITGGAIGSYPGRPRPLAINGHEYRRRRRTR
jgi:hypothetical protein